PSPLSLGARPPEGARADPERAARVAARRPALGIHRGRTARDLRPATARRGRGRRRHARARERAGVIAHADGRLRAGVVGAGHMGQYHILVYAELWDIELAGVVDVDRDRATRVAAHYDTRAFADHRDLIGRVDLVSVAVPTEQHFQVASDFLEAGVSVLLEKPITPTLEEARELFALARRTGAVLHVRHGEPRDRGEDPHARGHAVRRVHRPRLLRAGHPRPPTRRAGVHVESGVDPLPSRLLRRARPGAQGQSAEARDPPPRPGGEAGARGAAGRLGIGGRRSVAGDGPRDRAYDPGRARRGRLPEHPAVERSLGLMCGAGPRPAPLATEARRQGWRVVAFAFDDAPGVGPSADRVIPSRVTELGAVLQALRAEDVGAVLLGGKFWFRDVLGARRAAVAAVEALEGTTEAIRRGTALAGPGAVIVKAVAPSHDYRFDTPVVGPESLAAAADGRASVVAIEAGRVLVVDREASLRHA